MIKIIELSAEEIQALAGDLKMAAEQGWSVLVAIDSSPHEATAKFKVKIRGGIWSPPMGTEAGW